MLARGRSDDEGGSAGVLERGGGEVWRSGAEWCRGDAGWRRGRLMLREEEEVKCRCCFGTNVSLLFPLF